MKINQVVQQNVSKGRMSKQEFLKLQSKLIVS